MSRLANGVEGASINPQFLARFERRNIAKQLASEFDKPASINLQIGERLVDVKAVYNCRGKTKFHENCSNN